MKATSLFVALLLLFGPVVLIEASEPLCVILKTRIATERSSQSQTLIFTLEAGVEKDFGPKYPKLNVLVLPLEAGQIPLQISLVAASGQTLSSTIVYYTPETGAEFSLDAEGIDAQGQISNFSRCTPEEPS